MNRRSQFKSALGLCIAAVVFSAGCSAAPSETRQEHIHDMGRDVMPFALAKTTHIFQMTEQGGIERVIVKDPMDSDQIKLIQQHLQQEAAAFQKGDYSDPARLHGEEMPGLAALQNEAARVRVTYTTLPTGAEITFETADTHLLTAIHQWFGAQLSEHGADATYR